MADEKKPDQQKEKRVETILDEYGVPVWNQPPGWKPTFAEMVAQHTRTPVDDTPVTFTEEDRRRMGELQKKIDSLSREERIALLRKYQEEEK